MRDAAAQEPLAGWFVDLVIGEDSFRRGDYKRAFEAYRRCDLSSTAAGRYWVSYGQQSRKISSP
jgi:hypothetical protein